MLIFFKWLTSKIILSYYKFKGLQIHSRTNIHPTSLLSLGYSVKKGVIYIGEHSELSAGVVMKSYGGKIVLNDNVFLGEYVVIYGHGGVDIGENTLIAMHTCIVSSNHTIPDKNTLIRSEPDILLPVKIGRDVWIGANVKILGGVVIGDGCVIGAGAVVTKDLPPYSISNGVPATVKSFRE